MATAVEGVRTDRKNERKRVLLRATVFTPRGAYAVWLRDISSSGALVAGKDRLPGDCDVIFERGPLFAAARVVWSNDTGAGLEFYRNLSDRDLASVELPLPSRDA